MNEKFNKSELLELLGELNKRLILEDKIVDMYVYGGACLSLAYNMRESTADIDAIFGEKDTVNRLVKNIAKDYDIEDNWLNDSVKGFVSPGFEYTSFNQKFSNITIHYPTKEVLLAMKLVSSRIEDSEDIEDIKKLSKDLNLTNEREFWEIIEKYYPVNLVLPKTNYVILEVVEELKNETNTDLNWG